MWIYPHAEDYATDMKLFCRLVAPRQQVLACSMSLSAKDEISLVLPLPVPPGSPTDVIRFADLKDYPVFFGQLDCGFASHPARTDFEVKLERVRRPGGPLKIHLRAEYTTTHLLDYHSLNQIAPSVEESEAAWDRISSYRDYGFLVFRVQVAKTLATWVAEVRAARDQLFPLIDQLRSPLDRLHISGGHGSEQAAIMDAVHAFDYELNYLADDLCMRPGLRVIVWFALTFLHREPETLSFPSIEIIGGKANSEPAVNTSLYCQAEPSMENCLGNWQVSERPAGAFMPPSEVLHPMKKVYRTHLNDKLRKRDLVVGGSTS